MPISSTLPAPVLQAICQAGVQAPSADNRHELRFSVAGESIVVETTPAFRSCSARVQLLSTISYGAVVENMRIAASALGWRARPRWFPDQDTACILALEPTREEADGLVGSIAARHSNRGFFQGPALDAAGRQALRTEVLKIDGIRLLYLDTADVRRQALRLIRLAESERFRSDSLHRELFSSLRFDVPYGASCAEGIAPAASGVEERLWPVIRMMRHWPAMRALNLIGAARMMGWRVGDLPARFSPHLVAIVAEDGMPFAAARAGAGLERAWLKATQLGLAAQVIVAPAVFAAPEFSAAVSSPVRRKLLAGWEQLAPGMVPYALVRLGHAKPPAVRSLRPPLAHFLPPALTEGNSQ